MLEGGKVLRLMNKYMNIFNLAMKVMLEYRVNFILLLLSSAFVILIQCFLWTAIFESSGDDSVFGYKYSQMISYNILAGTLSRVMATGFEWEMAYDIKSGALSKYLVQPINYLGYRVSDFVGKKVIQLIVITAISCVVLRVLLFVMGDMGIVSDYFLLGFVSIAFAVIMNGLMFYCIGALAFWIVKTSAIFIGLEMAITIFSGGLFPLDVFGDELQAVFQFLPFQYIVFFPLNIFCGRMSNVEIAQGILIQILWGAGLFILSNILWKAGLRKYAAVGG